MASKFIYITGTAKWAKVFKPDEKYGNYTLDLYVDPKTLKKAQGEGLPVKVREDEEGTFIKLRRNPNKLFDGMSEQPEVLLHNEDGKYEKLDKLVGNGSLVTCKVCLYDTQMGTGHRLEAVAVENLVEYQSEGGNPDLPF